MRTRDALRRAVGYHLRAAVPTAAGLGIAGAGLWYGVAGGTPLRPDSLLASGRVGPVVVAAGVGVAVAAVGRTATRLDATAALVADELDADADEADVDVDELREDLAVAVRQAVADSHELTAADLESLVERTVERAVADAAERRPDRSASVDAAFADEALDEGEFARTDAADSRPDPLAEASERANERVESFLHGADTESDTGRTADAAGRGEGPSGAETSANGAEILTDDGPDPDFQDGVTDDAEIIDGRSPADDEADRRATDEGGMVFGTDVVDPDEQTDD
jgi:hypothetical protein